MLRIAVTGNIGAGKSYVSRLFELLDIPVFYSDKTAKYLIAVDKNLQKIIVDISGQSYKKDNEIDKKYLFKLLINDSATAEKINKAIHQSTIAAFNKWSADIEKRSEPPPYCIKESALVFEANATQGLDYIIGVDAPESIRERRYLQRADANPEKFRQIQKKQLPNSVKMKLANFVISNDGESLILNQLLRIDSRLRIYNQSKMK